MSTIGKKRRFIEIMRKYEKNPEIAEALKMIKEYKEETEKLRDNLIIENIRLKESQKNLNDFVAFYRHEAATPLNAIYGFSNFILNDPKMDEKDRNKQLSYIYMASEKAISLLSFLNNEVLQEKTEFNLEDLLSSNLMVNEELIKKSKLGINFRYNNNEVNSHKEIIDGVVGTILGNAYCWTPDYSRIDIGIRKDKGNKTEILVENKIAGKRRDACGEGKGIGQKSARGFIKSIGGEFNSYSKPEIVYNASKNRYETTKKIGNERATDNISEEDIIYGVKIRI